MAYQWLEIRHGQEQPLQSVRVHLHMDTWLRHQCVDVGQHAYTHTSALTSCAGGISSARVLYTRSAPSTSSIEASRRTMRDNLKGGRAQRLG